MLPRRLDLRAPAGAFSGRKRRRFRLLGLFLCFAVGAAPQASAQKLQFRQLTPDNGLSSSLVQSIVQDSRGFIWLGTRKGLNRYDGSGFTVYRHKADDSTSIADNNTVVVFEDSQKSLWVGTPIGLTLYDREHDNFINYPVVGTDSIEVTTILE